MSGATKLQTTKLEQSGRDDAPRRSSGFNPMAGVSLGALAMCAIPGVANADCVTTGSTTCTGDATTTQSIAGASADVTVNADASISVTDPDIYALVVESPLAVVRNNGDISATGATPHGIRVFNSDASSPSDSDLTVLNAGTVTTSVPGGGAGGVGILVNNEFGTATVVNQASGVIDSAGFGIQVQTEGGEGTATNNGALNAASTGMVVTTRGGFDALATNTGTIEAGVYGTYADATGGGAAATVNDGAIVAGSAGMLASAESGSVSAVNSGAITTTNTLASGILTFAGEGADTTIVNAEGATITLGDTRTRGIWGRGVSTGAGAPGGVINITNNGSILSTATDTSGIHLQNAVGGGVVAIGETGVIDVTRRGMLLETDQGDAIVTNAGAVSSGYTAIEARTTNGFDVRLTNTGTITNGANGDAMVVSSTGAGDAINAADGEIVSGRDGIAVRSNGTSATASNAGTITAAGSGVYTYFTDASNPDGVASAINSGTIAATNAGVFAFNYGTGVATMANSGAITVDGSNAQGVSGGGKGAVTATNSGAIDVTGDFSKGIYTTAQEAAVTHIVNEAAGEIEFEGANTIGIHGEAYNGAAGSPTGATIDVINSGQIHSASAAAVGIFAENGSDGDARTTVANAAGGAVSLDGDDAIGVSVSARTGGSTIDNAGMINVGAAGVGLKVNHAIDGDSDVANSGTISAGGLAIDSLFANGGAFSLTNTGTIEGGVRLANSIDRITSSGDIVGDIDLGDGDDVVEFNASATLIGDILGGLGADAWNLNGLEAFAYSGRIAGVELVSLNDSLVSFDGARIEGGQGVSIASDATLQAVGAGADLSLTDALSNNGVVDIAAGSTLAILDGGGFVANAGSTTIFGVASETGLLTAEGAIDFLSGSQIEIDVTDMDSLAHGRAFDAAVSGATLTDASGELVDNSAMFDFVKQIFGENTLRITAEQVLRLEEAADPTDPNAIAVSTALQSFIDTGSADATVLSTALGQIDEISDLAVAVSTFLPSESNGMVLSQSLAASDLMRTVAQQGRGAVADPAGSRIWAVGRFGSAQLGADGYRSGYDSRTNSATFGAEIPLAASAGARLGAAYSYASTDVDDNTSAISTAEISSHSVLAYLNLSRGDWRTHLSIGAADLEATSLRAIPILSEQVSANPKGTQLLSRLEIGRDFELESWTIGPRASISYANTTFDSYSETGSIAALQVSGNNAVSLRTEVDLEVERSLYRPESGRWFFGGRLGVYHEASDLGGSRKVAFPSDGTVFQALVNSGPGTGLQFATEASFLGRSGLEISFGYEGTLEQNFQQHSAVVRAKLRL